MQKDIRSYNSRVSGQIIQLVIPSQAQMVLNFVIAALLLAILNIRGLWHFISGGSTNVSRADFGSLISDRAPFVHDTFLKLAHGRFVQFLFWVFVGCVVYLLIWFIGNFFTNIRNDIVADEYIHPKSYNRAGYWSSILAKKIFFVAMVGILLAYLYAGLKFLAILADLIYSSVINDQWWDSTLQVIGHLIIAALMIQLFFVLVKLTLNSWQIIYRDL